jgi:Flp pilus assembly pilin Flp
MNRWMLNLLICLETLRNDETGQDLAEYALVVALIALGSTVALNSLASGLNNGFLNISSTLASSLS